jgi:hypothetical protein
MSTPFLLQFASSLVPALCEHGDVELFPGATQNAVVAFMADRLGGARDGSSLVSTVVAALVACPEVEELYADNETLIARIEDLKGRASLR